MKRIIVISKKDNVEVSIGKGYRFRLIAENMVTGVKFAPPLTRPWQWKAAIENAKNWRPPK